MRLSLADECVTLLDRMVAGNRVTTEHLSRERRTSRLKLPKLQHSSTVGDIFTFRVDTGQDVKLLKLEL